MTIELIALGLVVGTLSGFFGTGGGTVTIPILLYMGFGIKEAIGISVVQMVAGSITAAWIHKKQDVYDITSVKYFGIGGFIGASVGAILVKVLHSSTLEWCFLGVVSFALGKLIISNPQPTGVETVNHPLYVLIGTSIGVFAGMMGVGGAILMTPILVGFMGFNLKKASAIGLFFVLSTSVSSLITLTYFGLINWYVGLLIAFSSLLGIYIGVALSHKIHLSHFKRVLVTFYILIFAITAYKLLLG
jgi:hypothetical protein